MAVTGNRFGGMECFRVDDRRCIHGASCNFQPISLPASCVLCLLDDLCNKDQPVSKRTRLLSELTSCLTSGSRLVQAVSEQHQLLLRMVDALTGGCIVLHKCTAYVSSEWIDSFYN